MKLLFASDSFKGSLTSAQTAALLEKAARAVFGADVVCDGVPVADGGEGTVDAVVAAGGGCFVDVGVCGPVGQPVRARYGKLDEKRAIMEMAAASGLTLVPELLRNPLRATSRGTGEMIRDALDRGFSELSVAIGGSATNDGGMGCAAALGVRFYDRDGRELAGCGEDLERVCSIDTSALDERVKKAKITVMCDVKNPLCGENGATMTYGAQKGASGAVLEQLEAGMRNYRNVIRRTFGVDPDTIEGAGAAGGLGTALTVFFGGEMQSGIETVLDLVGFDRKLEGVDLVVTGEGRADAQSVCGKVMRGVGERAKKKGVPVVGLCGSLGDGAEKLFDFGIDSLMTTVDAPMPLSEALGRAEELYYAGAVRMFRLLKVGAKIENRKR